MNNRRSLWGKLLSSMIRLRMNVTRRNVHTSSGARKNDVNAMRCFAGNSWFCQAHAFKYGHPLQPITILSFVCFISRNFIPSHISHPAILFTMLKGFLYCGSFIVHVLLLETCKAFTVSVFLLSASIHVVSFLGTRRYVRHV